LRTNTTNAELIGGGGVTAFNSDGFTTGTNGAVTASGDDFVSWTFRKQPGFFDVVTYTGDGVAGRTVSHNLGSVPGMIIVKSTSNAYDWMVYHRGTASDAETDYLSLNLTNQVGDSPNFWNDTAPTDSVFSVGTSSKVNGSGMTYVAYLFAHDAQDFGTDSDEAIIKCGEVGTFGNTVDLGWEAQWIMMKRIDSISDWYMFDSMRGLTYVFNGQATLQANLSSAESNTGYITPTTTGFTKSLTGSYLYVAIRRPHKPASEFDATDLLETVAGTGNPPPNFISGFPVDMYFNRKPSTSDNWDWSSRLTQEKILQSNSTNAESTNTDFSFDYQNGVMSGGYASTVQSWMFRRAPGFFDVVAYTGNGTARTIEHNLNSAPQFMIVKKRSATGQWICYHEGIGNGYGVRLEATSAPLQSISYWNNTTPTDTVFSLSTNSNVNGSGATFVAYLFATVDGISKVGTYTGTGSDVDIDCGFTSGARFVLIRRFKDGTISAGTGNWYLWDSERGITTGPDPYLLLNSTAAQTTSFDYIDPLSSGFTITSSAPAEINASADEYIFLAIA
jgi:hypothetical protein